MAPPVTGAPGQPGEPGTIRITYLNFNLQNYILSYIIDNLCRTFF